jgi:hypothetical protein
MLGIDELETNTRELFYQACMGVCGYILSCQALNNTASQEPGGHGACLVLKSPHVTRRVCNEWTGGKIMSVHDREGRHGMVCSWVWFFLGRWLLLFSQEWWGRIQYRLHDSPAACHWWKSVIFKFMGHNWWPAVPKVQDLDKGFLFSEIKYYYVASRDLYLEFVVTKKFKFWVKY